jgi:uncharacterized protein (AIM24 family)
MNTVSFKDGGKIGGAEVGIDYIQVNHRDFLAASGKVEGDVEAQVCLSAAVVSANERVALKIRGFTSNPSDTTDYFEF